MLIRRKKQVGQKKFPQQTKKVQLETRAYCTYFLLLTTPYVMFEWKRNSKFLLLIRRKEQIGQKKFGQQTKKVRLETRAYCTYYLLFTTPYGMFEWKNILIGAQVFCWPKIINPLGHKTILRPSAEGWFCVLRWNKSNNTMG